MSAKILYSNWSSWIIDALEDTDYNYCDGINFYFNYISNVIKRGLSVTNILKYKKNSWNDGN